MAPKSAIQEAWKPTAAILFFGPGEPFLPQGFVFVDLPAQRHKDSHLQFSVHAAVSRHNRSIAFAEDDAAHE